MTDHSEAATRTNAFTALIQVMRLSYSVEATRFMAADLADIPTHVFVAACHRLVQRAERIGNPIAAIRREAAECRGVGGPSTQSYRIVCEACGETRHVGPGDMGWGTHYCEMQTRVDAWRSTHPNQRPPWPITDEDRAAIHARGMAACTGQAQKVKT